MYQVILQTLLTLVLNGSHVYMLHVQIILLKYVCLDMLAIV